MVFRFLFILCIFTCVFSIECQAETVCIRPVQLTIKELADRQSAGVISEDVVQQNKDYLFGKYCATTDEVIASTSSILLGDRCELKSGYRLGELVYWSACLDPDQSAGPLPPQRESALKPSDSFKECEDCPWMTVVPAGSFVMGSPQSEPRRESVEGPQVTIAVPHPFAVGKFEVTRGEYEAFINATGYKVTEDCRVWNHSLATWDRRLSVSFRNAWFAQDDNHPAVCVNWTDAKMYVRWLSAKTGKQYRLLSESEWEYVARAGTKTPFWWGSTISTDQANYDGRVVYGKGLKGPWRQGTLPVGTFSANAWGLYDVHGNVWEWVEDCYSYGRGYQRLSKSTLATGEASSQKCAEDAHAFRGGSWLDDPEYLRSAKRVGARPGGRVNYLGFRVARTLTP